MTRRREDAYSRVAILFHWIVAALFFGLLGLGFVMRRTESMALQFNLYQWHKSFGFLILGLSIVRLLLLPIQSRPRETPAVTPMERMAARAAQFMLLAMLLVIPLTGWAVASVTPLEIPSLFLNLILIPHLPMANSIEAEAFWSFWHAALAYAAGVLATGHALAALRHHFILKDDVLTRMLRPGRKQQ